MRRKSVYRNAFVSLALLIPTSTIVIVGNSGGGKLPDSGFFYYFLSSTLAFSALLFMLGVWLPVGVTIIRKMTPEEKWQEPRYAGARLMAYVFLIDDAREN